MKITNKQNLPEAIVRAVSKDNYTMGDAKISVTGMIGPPQKRILTGKHWDELEEDAADRIWALFGTAVHYIIEQSATEDELQEITLNAEVLGWKIKGQVDCYQTKTLIVTDWKTASVWKIVFGNYDDWEKQLNVYAELTRQNGGEVKGIEVVAILKDWKKSEALRNPDYPQQAAVTIKLNLWDSKTAKAYIAERVKIHQAAEAGENIPCSDEERWKKEDVFAIHKPNVKTAKKLCKSQDEAEKYIADYFASVEKSNETAKKKKTPDKLYVDLRPGKYTRCEEYCSVSKFCKQFQATKTPAGAEKKSATKEFDPNNLTQANE